MRIIDTREPLLRMVEAAALAAAEDTRQDIIAGQARVTGNLADSTDVTSEVGPKSGVKAWIFNPVVYAGVRERGANTREKASVKKRTKARGIYEVQANGKRKRVGYEAGPLLNRKTARGPHMIGNHVVADNGPRFLGHMTDRLRRA